MYGNGFVTTNIRPTVSVSGTVWMIVSLILAVIGCFVVYFLFVKKDIKTDNKFLAWLKSFLSFDIMLVEPILKIAYLFVVIFLTLSSFSLISESFLAFLMYLVFGNILARVLYEILLIKIMIWKNTNEIKKKLK